MNKKAIKLYNEIQDFKLEEKTNLVILLLNRIAFLLRMVKEYIITKNYKDKSKAITQINTIVNNGLIDYLDFKNYPEESNNLKDFYINSLLQLTMANIKNDTKVIDLLIDNYEQMSLIWEQENIKQRKENKYEDRGQSKFK